MNARSTRGTALALLLAPPCLVVTACSPGAPTVEDQTELFAGRGSSPTRLQIDPATGLAFVPEGDAGAADREPRLVALSWGRLVDVWAADPGSGDPLPVLRQVVVGPEVEGAGADYELSASLVGSGWKLEVLHPVGSPGFDAVLRRLEAGRVEVAPRSLASLPAQALPCDAALVAHFDGLLAADAAPLSALRLDEARVLLDPSHGVLIDGSYHSSRVLLLPPAAGWPTGEDLVLSGAAFSGSHGRGPAHVLRSSGEPLSDGQAPHVVGRQPGQVTAVYPGPLPSILGVDYLYDTAGCAVALEVGDTLETATHLAEVLAQTDAPVGGLVSQVRLGLVAGDPNTFGVGPAQVVTRWDPAKGVRAECYVSFSPPARKAPAQGVSPDASVIVEFSEPMDPSSVQALDSFRVAYATPPSANALFSHVVGAIAPSSTLRRYRFDPSVPLRHASGVAERYRVQLEGVLDAAGNGLAIPLPETTFLLDRTAPSVASSGFALTFFAADEDGDGANELRGGLLYDLAEEVVKPRPVTRFSAVLDASQPMIGVMPQFTQGLTTPLSPFGSKLMATWRYVDMGFTLLDPLNHDLDVEGLAWAPFGGSVLPDTYSEFRMALAHAGKLPDEAVGVALLPAYKNSGLVPTFDGNLLSPTEDPLTVVHPKSKGYAVNPADTFVASTGTVMHPWPLNRNVPASQYQYWTWRDTSKLSRSAPLGAGADPQRLLQVTGMGLVGFYPKDEVPTIGLPLLTEFRCYPDSMAFGLNGLRTAFALNSSYKPTFRAYSTGGVFGTNIKLVDPDNEPVAQGGVNPNTGGPTLPIDNTVYIGQADFVVRVTRGHTRWVDTGGTSQLGALVLEPVATGQPAGTQAVVALRGASAIMSPGSQPWVDAANLDPYGNAFTTAQLVSLQLPMSNTFDVTYFPTAGDDAWTSAANQSALDGTRYVQARITLVSNAENGQTPELSGLGLAWLE